jgi:hypothetical protein
MSAILLREQALETIRSMVADKVISPHDLCKFIPKESDITDPEYVREEMEIWYKTLGITDVVGGDFSLKLPYFSKEEIRAAYENDEIILCVPKGITRRHLGILFKLKSWALTDELIGLTTENEDFWFKTKNSLIPEYLDKPGNEIRKMYENEGKLGMSLERYIVLVARIRYLTGKTPDIRHKTWITNGKYDGKGMLIAGFDSKNNFSVHGWLPHFHTPQLGGRYVIIPDHLYI